MARVGLQNFTVAKLTQDDSEGVKYESPKRIAKMIEVSLTPQTSEGSLYADDVLSEYNADVTGYDVSINVDDLTPENRAFLLGYDVDDNGAIATTTDVPDEKFAVMFQSRRSDGSNEYRVMYKVKFSIPEDTYHTKGDSVEYQTPTITGKALALDFNNKFDAMLVGNEDNKSITDQWFTAVYVHGGDTESLSSSEPGSLPSDEGFGA